MRTRRAAAAACAFLGLSVLAACGEEDGADPDADGTQTTSVSPSMTPPSDGPTKLTMRGLPEGSAPAIAYVAADDPADPSGSWSLVRPSGETLALDVSGPFGFATTGNGLVVIGDGGGDGAVVSVVDGNGVETSREDVLGYRLAVTPDGAVVAWLTADRSVRVLEGGGRSFDFGAEEFGSEIGAIWGRATCLESQGGGCSAYVNVDEPRSVYRTTTTHGIVNTVGSMLTVTDVDVDGRVTGLISVTDEGSCSAVYTEPAEKAWQTCDHTLTTFSPDGTRVLGTDAYLDGFGQRSVVFLDAEGTVLREFVSRGRGATVLQTAWEDADHVLAVLYERGRWSIARLGVDGSAELALGPVEGSDLDRPFVLEQD